MEHDLVLEGRAVLPSGLEETEIGVDDGVISEVRRGLKGARRIRTGRCIVFPGFVDMHVHMREPGWEHKEDFRHGTLAAVHGGVTTVVDMPNNPTPTTSRAALEQKQRLAEERGVVDVKFYGGVVPANVSALAELEGAVGYKLFLSETTGTGAFPEVELGRAFGEVAKTSKPAAMHCEDQPIIDRRKMELKGVESQDVYCDLRPPEAEVEAVRKAVAALRGSPKARADVCHASTEGTLSLVRGARGEGLHLRCEAALHHVYFNRKRMLESALLKTNPPLRAEEDRQALVGGLRGGGVSFLVTDHAPHTEEEKLGQGAAGVPGLDDYAHVVSWLMREQEFDPILVARISSSNPSRFLGLGDRGEISPGRRADFAVLDLHSPERVRNEDVRSKCGWSPYEGKEFPGRARWTVSRGRVLLDDFEWAT